MRQTLAEIAESTDHLRRHPFFARLRPDPDLGQMLAFAPSGTFWVMTFQDIISLNADLTTDPVIRALVEKHRLEDTGHEQWFLADIERIFGAVPTSIPWLFSAENRRVRAVSFALSAEVFRIQDDILRLVLLEVLEAAAGAYFAGISSALTVAGHAGKLKYFAGQHLEAEAGHEMHDAASDQIRSMVLSPEQRIQARGLVDRMFTSFHQLGDALLEAYDRIPPFRPSSPDQRESTAETSKVQMKQQNTAPIPGPRAIPLLGGAGSLLRFFRDPIRCMNDLQTRYGDVAAVSAGEMSLVCAFGPEINRQVLSNPDQFQTAAELPIRIPKGSALDRLTTFLVGMNGEEHKRLRRAMSPLFQRGQLESYRVDMVAAAESVLSKWQAGTTVNLSAAMAELALCVAFRCLFGLDVSAQSESLARIALDFTEGATSLKLIVAPFNAPGSPYRQFLKLSEQLEARLLELIAERRGNATQKHDVLSVLMNAKGDDGKTLPDSMLVGLANELFIAGHETTASTLAWTLFLLERHPEVLNALLEELSGKLHGGAPTLADIEQLPVLDAVVKESMRLLSATPFLFFRKNAGTVQIGGHELPSGSKLVISPLMTHHRPELYRDPKRFLPDRWKSLEPGPYEYLPFGAGPRTCLGAAFATLSLRVMLSLVVQRYRFSAPEGSKLSYRVRGVILGTKDGMTMRVERQERKLVQPNPIHGNIHELVDLPR